jgi:probable dihydroxyacetone kinase regulator
MTASLITKKIIAGSLKRLMETESFHRISVGDIMRACDMRRQTFYYHFIDKYELLGWIYKEETKENIEDFLDYERWETIFDLLLEYFYENQQFYRRAFQVTEQNSFNHYLYEHTMGLTSKIMNELVSAGGIEISAERRNAIASFYSHGFVGTVKAWIENHCPMAPLVLSSLMKEMIHNQLLQVRWRNE